MFPKELGVTTKPIKSAQSHEQKIIRQAKHVLERIKRESAAKTTTKKPLAMMSGPYTASEAQGGVTYITFDDSGIDNATITAAF